MDAKLRRAFLQGFSYGRLAGLERSILSQANIDKECERVIAQISREDLPRHTRKVK